MPSLQKGFIVSGKIISILLLSMLALFSLLGLLKLLFSILPFFEIQSSSLFFLLMCLNTLAYILAAAILYNAFERNKWVMGWQQQGSVKAFCRGMLLGITFMTISFLLIWLFGGLSITQVQIEPQLWVSICQAILLFLLVAVSEEVFNRGYIQGLIKHHYGKVWAIAISSTIFGLLHSFNPGVFDHTLPLLNLFLAGLLLGISREVSGGLWLPIGIHFTWNFFQGNIYGFAVSGMNMTSIIKQEPTEELIISGGAFGAEGSIMTSLVLVIGCFYLYRRYSKRDI